MKRTLAVLALILGIVGLTGSTYADMYKWTDENGNLHFASSLNDVPPRYRAKASKISSDPTPPPAAPAAPTTPEAPGAESAPTTGPAATAEDGSTAGLRQIRVPYKNEGNTRRVIIPVKFNDSITAPMALDTGSPGMVISVDLAVRLGIFDRDSGTLITAAGGIGGTVPAILTIVDSVSVQQARDTFIPTTVTNALSDEFDGLIGMDFLANYNISIDSRNKMVVFQETPPLSNSRGGHDQDWWRRTFEDFREVSDRWRDYVDSINRRSNTRSTGFAEFQMREADRLLQRLHQHASENAVPQHWR